MHSTHIGSIVVPKAILQLALLGKCGEVNEREQHRREEDQPARVRGERHTKIDAGPAHVHGIAAHSVRTKRHEPVGTLQIQLRCRACRPSCERNATRDAAPTGDAAEAAYRRVRLWPDALEQKPTGKEAEMR